MNLLFHAVELIAALLIIRGSCKLLRSVQSKKKILPPITVPKNRPVPNEQTEEEEHAEEQSIWA